MRHMRLWVTVGVLLFATGLPAQGKPDFSGKWINVTPEPAPGEAWLLAGKMVIGPCGEGCTIAQDAATLTVIRTTPFIEQKHSYKLDGSASKNKGGRGQEVVSKAMWEGNKIVISDDGGQGRTVTTTISMASGMMEVEIALQGGFALPPPPKQIYKKN